jgi:hypothetical protein
MDPSASLLRPYIVSAFFGVPNGAGMIFTSIRGAPSPENASAALVADYYGGGGRLPMVGINVQEVSREQAQAAIAMLDAIDAAKQQQEARVVRIVPNGADPQPDHEAEDPKFPPPPELPPGIA